jgi:3-oxoacyl-[acyl-carrier-protein] synthase-1
MRKYCYLEALGVVNALGRGANEVVARLFLGDTSGMVLENGWLSGSAARVGRARGDLPEISESLVDYRCRNNRLLLAALAQIESAVDTALSRYGRGRIGVVIGSSTSGIAEGELAIAAYRAHGTLPEDYRYVQQAVGIPAVFLSRHLNLGGPAYTVSTACTSSAKAFSSARNLIRHGICDAVLVGGVDSLCRLTINGFSALESMSNDLSQPMSRNRRGINIGEGAALFLMSAKESAVQLLGIGETSDAYHMSAPHPEGIGAEAAMRAALADASIEGCAVDYLNLHATATRKNDEMESRAVARVFSDGVSASGTKQLSGHTLGASGATELAFCWLALREGKLPPHVWDGEADPELPRLNLVGADCRFARTVGRICMSNSFAFGGSNASLVIGDAK